MSFSQLPQFMRRVTPASFLNSHAETNVVDHSIGDRLTLNDSISKRWAASLLFVGSVLGIMAFGLSVAAMLLTRKITPNMDCFDEEPCQSGERYMPETFSEMVSIASSPAGKLFQSLGVIASLCLLISRYPFHLDNVKTPLMAQCSVVGTRAVMIPVGMLMVAWIPITPRAKRTVVDKMVADVHTFGALLFVAGYILVELYTLCRLWRNLRKCERFWRAIALVFIIIFTVCFELLGAAFAKGPDAGVCCFDEWVDTTEAFEVRFGNMTEPSASVMLELMKFKYGGKVLVDSASGLALRIKMAELISEMFAGISILMSHMMIWYFSTERHTRIE